MIPSEYSQDIENLRLSIDEVIDSMRYNQYLFNGIPDEQNIGSLEIKFRNGSYLSLDTKGDGQSVEASKELKVMPEPFYLGKSAYCEWGSAKITEFGSHAQFEGTIISSVEAIIDSRNGLPEFISGWILHFENGNFLVYSNSGDNGSLFVNQFPAAEPGVVSRQEIVATKL